MARLRPPLAVLNELSATANRPFSEDDLIEIVSMFASAVRALRRIRNDVVLVTSDGLSGLLVTEDGGSLTAFALARGGRTRDEWRYIQQTRNHAPFATAPDLNLVDASEEFRCRGEVAAGLGLAASNRQLAVSLVSTSWPDPEIELDHVWLEETDSGDVVERVEPAFAHHASTTGHVESHREFVIGLALPDPFAGADVWEDRVGLYPHLRFLSRVEDQMRGLPSGSDALRQVAIRLRELDEATAEWDPAGSAFPDWRSHVTPEGEQRKQLCVFRDLDGEDRCFDLHARFTPGAGRIHFRLAPIGTPCLVIAHVGKKL
jgi:hypothetical protein